jgi:hypothetical protein
MLHSIHYRVSPLVDSSSGLHHHSIIIIEEGVMHSMLRQLFIALLTVGVLAGTVPAKEKKDQQVMVIVKHEVKDYAEWKKGYDADAGNRKTAGFKVHGVYADVNNPNMVYVVGMFPSVEAANAFIASPKLKDAMEHAGVVGKPDIMIVREVAKR